MNFTYNEDQLAIKDVSDRIFRDLGGDEQIKAVYKDETPFHKELWQQLANSGMLAVALSSEFGGSEMGMTELGLVIEGLGTSVAPIPFVETVVECAMPINQFASVELKKRLLTGVASGELVLSPVRPYDGLRGRKPVTAQGNKDGWVLNGYSNLVNYAAVADGFLVTAHLKEGGYWVGYCESDTPGIEITRQRSASGETAGHVEFNNVSIAQSQVVAIGTDADSLIEWASQRTYATLAALQVGVLEEGLKKAAEYTNERKQFGRPLSSFQAVAQQAADAYMAIEALRGVYWRAVDDLDNGGDAALSSRVAKFWVCEAGHTAAHISLHIHGGIGQDLDFPAHRYFIWAKKNEHYLGAAPNHSKVLGQMIQENIERVA